MKIEVKCQVCGSNNFELRNARTDDCEVSCGECGHVVGTMGDLKKKFAEEVMRLSRSR